MTHPTSAVPDLRRPPVCAPPLYTLRTTDSHNTTLHSPRKPSVASSMTRRKDKTKATSASISYQVKFSLDHFLRIRPRSKRRVTGETCRSRANHACRTHHNIRPSADIVKVIRRYRSVKEQYFTATFRTLMGNSFKNRHHYTSVNRNPSVPI